jgi:hypothetical protein
MALPVDKRPYDAFLSYAHADRTFVDSLYKWLNNTCGLDIWYDAVEMPPSSPIRSGLQRGIEKSRGLLLIGSPEAISRGWVQEEVEIAGVERGDSADFRIIPLRLANADLADLIKGYSWVDLPTGQLDAAAAAGILQAFYPKDNRPRPGRTRDVYVSASWQSADNISGLAVMKSLCQAGFRVIGDAKDQKGFKTDRVQSIIASCGAFVGVIPYRDNTDCASTNDRPYKYFLTELDVAVKADIPVVVVADPKIRRVDGEDQSWLRMDTHESRCPKDVQTAVTDLWEQWSDPPRPHYIFFAADLDSQSVEKSSAIRKTIECVAGMPTVIGTEIQEPDLQSAIMRTIKESLLVIADITGSSESTFNVNCCIEAGMASAYGVDVALMAKGQPRSPPFMLRRAGQLYTYLNDVEQLGVIHHIARKYRRRVVNAELPQILRQT